jgi:hypothetical protein
MIVVYLIGMKRNTTRKRGGHARLRRATMRDIRRIQRQNGGVVTLLLAAQTTPALLSIGNFLISGVGNIVSYTMNIADGVDKVKSLFDLQDFVGSFIESSA